MPTERQMEDCLIAAHQLHSAVRLVLRMGTDKTLMAQMESAADAYFTANAKMWLPVPTQEVRTKLE